VPNSSTQLSAQRNFLPGFGNLSDFGIKYLNATIMNSYAAIKDRIAEDLASNDKNVKPNLRKLGEKFSVPYTHLYARAKGCPS
jgi:hypothetical protein